MIDLHEHYETDEQTGDIYVGWVYELSSFGRPDYTQEQLHERRLERQGLLCWTSWEHRHRYDDSVPPF